MPTRSDSQLFQDMLDNIARIERYTASLDENERKQPDVAKAMEAIARDTAVRDRFLAFARDADRPEIAARMMVLSRDLGWLTTA